MTNPHLGDNPLALALIIVLALYFFTSFGAMMAWIVVSVRKYSTSKLWRQIMFRGGILVSSYMVIAGVILLVAGYPLENVLCGFAFVFVAVTLMYWLASVNHQHIVREEPKLETSRNHGLNP